LAAVLADLGQRRIIVRLRTKLQTLRVPAAIVTLRGRGCRLAPDAEVTPEAG